ncbi:hypothetical protein BDZ97DRAFT_1835325 [Flammula alnicola]|nr:hypothetical protein BDZ97DRAFT_1835325 [Flammula alnicola]
MILINSSSITSCNPSHSRVSKENVQWSSRENASRPLIGHRLPTMRSSPNFVSFDSVPSNVLSLITSLL